MTPSPRGLPELLRAVEQCELATHRALMDAAKSRAIPATGDDAGIHDPAWCVAVEATCLLAAVRELLGKPPRKAYYA